MTEGNARRLGRYLLTPRFQAQFNSAGVVLFIVLSVPSVLLWSHSVPWLVYLSVYAVVIGHWSAAVAGLAAIQAERARQDVEAVQRRAELEAVQRRAELGSGSLRRTDPVDSGPGDRAQRSDDIRGEDGP